MLAKISEDPIGEQQTTIKAGSRYMIQKRAQNASMNKKERLRSLSKSKQRGKALAEREQKERDDKSLEKMKGKVPISFGYRSEQQPDGIRARSQIATLEVSANRAELNESPGNPNRMQRGVRNQNSASRFAHKEKWPSQAQAVEEAKEIIQTQNSSSSNRVGYTPLKPKKIYGRQLEDIQPQRNNSQLASTNQVQSLGNLGNIVNTQSFMDDLPDSPTQPDRYAHLSGRRESNGRGQQPT